MVALSHFYWRFRHLQAPHQPLFLLGGMLFFWTIFDGILSYLVPIAITRSGYSATVMGIIIGSSSLFGLIFDFFISQKFRNFHFRRIYTFVFVLSALFLVLMWQGELPGYLVAMAVWGLYYDLVTFGNFNFVARLTHVKEHALGFGIIDVFKSLGYLISPVVAGFVIAEVLDPTPFLTALLFLISAAVLFIFGINRIPQKAFIYNPSPKNHPSFIEGLIRLKKLIRPLFPVLLVFISINLIDAFFWSLGPLFAEQLKHTHILGRFLIPIYYFPALVMGWFVGSISTKIGKKNTSYIALFFGALMLMFIGYVRQPIFFLILAFLSAIFTSLAWPAIRGMCADLIVERVDLESDITGVADIGINIGYIVGPILGGFLADTFDIQRAFALLGTWLAFMALLLLFFAPQQIRLPKGN